MKTEQTTLTCQASEEQIAAWKAKYKEGIYAITCGTHVAYFKNPGRAELNCAMSKADKERMLDVYEELASLTWVGGSEAILADDQMFVGACQILKEKLDGKRATLVNL
jgi:hypothetical protein